MVRRRASLPVLRRWRPRGFQGGPAWSGAPAAT